MKNFTNNFKQFTSRLSARWLIMALMLLVVTSSLWGKTIYFKANGSNNWAADNAVIQISVGSNTSWKKMTSLGNGMYSYEANNGTTVYFARGASEGSTWNVTGKLTVPSDKNLFTPNAWSNCTGDWSTYTPPTTYTGTIKFQRPSAWKNVPHIHMFYDGSNTLLSNTTMELEGVDASGNTWYTYDYSITTTFTTATIMFNNGGWNNGQTEEQFKGNLGTDYCLASATSTTSTRGDVTSVTCPVYCTPPAAPTLNSNSTTVCSGTSFDLPSGYRWYTVATGGTKLASNTISAGITQKTIYYAEAGEDGCVSTSRTAYTVNVNDKPAVPTLSADKTSLIGDEKAIFTVGNTVSGLTYTLYNGENAGESQTSTGSNLTFKAGGEGSYTVRVTNSCGTSISTPAIEITVCTPQTNEFRHANSSYTQLQDQPTYYPGDKAYFVSTINCCLTGTWSANLQKGEEAWWAGLSGSTPKFSMTLTRAGNFTITNMATNGCTQDKNVLVNLDFTVTALSEVTNANGTASGANIALTWNRSATHSKVMVVRYPSSGTETIPAGGQAYTADNTLGGGTVVYVGTAESYTDQNLPAGVSYKYYFYTVNNNYYSEGVVLNMSSCPTPAKPQLESTAVTACNGNVTTFGSITITNIADYDNTYTFKLGDRTANPDANGKIVISSADNTEYTVTVTNSCGNQNSATVDIAINDNKPTISGPTYAQPGKDNAIELTLPAGISAKWSVSPEADLSVNEGNSTKFSAEKNGTYTITADNKGCTDTHVVTVSDAFYVYMRQPKKGETAYNNFYYPTQNPTQGGDLFYKEYASIPPAEGYTDYNKGGVAHDIIFTDCDGYVWYGFKASDKLIDGTNYFTVHAPNKNGYDGWFTHTDITKPGKMTGDIYYIMGTEGNGNSCWKIEEASAPYSGPVVHASGNDFSFNKNNFADFVALYVTDCSGKEIDYYQWQYSQTENGKYDDYSSVCTYVGKKSEQGDAGKTNNIRPNVAGWYRCIATYKDGSSLTSAAKQVTATSGTSYSFTSDLPIIMVNTNGYGFPSCDGLSGTASKNADVLKAKISVDVKIYEDETLVYDRKARMNYRGSSSLNFVKKSYAFCPGKADCVEDKGRVDYVKTEKLNMLGVGSAVDKDWVLYAAAADPSLMRNRLVFDSYAAMTGEWGVQSRYVELIVDGVYKGVYVFMDKITMNEKRVKVDEKTGFIVKFDKTDKEDRIGGYNGVYGDEKTFATDLTGRKDISTYDTSVDQLFEIEYPEKDDYPTGWGNRTTAIKNMFNNFENALKDGDFTTVQQYIDYTSWADWFIINEYTKNVDAYRASCIFVYTGEAGAKIEARPLWDQELSFDNTATTVGKGKACNSTSGLLVEHDEVYKDGFPAPFWFTGNYSTSNGQFTKDKYKGLLDDPCFVQVVKERWETHKAGALSEATLQNRITEYYNDLADYDESTKQYAASSGKTREEAFWSDKSRGTCDCSYDKGNATATGYSNVAMAASKGTMDTWVLDAQRRAGLSTAISGLTGTTMNIQILPSTQNITPWEAATITINKSEGYDYTLENDLEAVSGVVVQKNGQSITYRIPRPSTWGTGDGNDSRDDITYTITATLNVADGTMVCGTTTAPSSTATIILQDEKDENCPQ